VSAGTWRPLGFLLLMVGFGLRLDTGWQGAAWVFLLGGAASVALGFRDLARGGAEAGAFVPPRGKG
jgi:hypothetical protein